MKHLKLNLIVILALAACGPKPDTAKPAESTTGSVTSTGDSGTSGVTSTGGSGTSGVASTVGVASTSGVASTGGSGTSGSAALQFLGHGDVLLQKLTVTAGQLVTTSLSLGHSALTLADGPKNAPLEVSVTSADGTETTYTRATLGDSTVAFTPAADGDMTIVVKSNDPNPAAVDGVSVDGALAQGAPVSGAARTDTPYGDLLLKGIVALANQCLANNPATGHRDAVQAPAGRVYVQPFVFYGKVGADKKVTPLTAAKITLAAGGETVTLKRLDDIDYHKYETDAVRGGANVQLANARSFYQGYFAGAGQLYTVDGFFSGECADSVTLPVPGPDVGTAAITLTIDDQSLATPLTKTYPVRATLQPPFETYVSDGVKLSDYTQCTYDKKTGEPATYNGDAAACKTFSVANPPAEVSDYPPSAGGGGVTSASDPTRLFYYGYATPKAWMKTLIADNTQLIAATKTAETFPGCLNTGGILAVPLSKGKTYLPLAELNATAGDVINLARRTGSYTAFEDFYQGDVDASETASLNFCVPDPTGACNPTTFAVTTTGCTLKADSGLSALSLSDAMVYPGYFEMSGVVAP